MDYPDRLLIADCVCLPRKSYHISHLAPAAIQNKVRSGAYITRLLFMMTMLPFWYFLPQMMQHQYGFSAFESGLAFLPMTLVNFVVALWLPRLTNRFGNGRILLVGEIVLAAGLLILTLSDSANATGKQFSYPC